jgi:hypothetical protein
VEELREQLRQKQEELDELRKLTPADLWIRYVHRFWAIRSCM